MKVASYDIVFQEIPGEVTLALNLSGCPCHCPGCHSKHLWEDIGEPLDRELLDGLIARYPGLITCVAFMGGDQDPEEVARLAEYVKSGKSKEGSREIKTAWYSGRTHFPKDDQAFDYVKLGGYVEALGGLKSEKTNQRLYKREGSQWIDITNSFWKKKL